MAEEFKNPTKDVPKSMILSLVTCCILFSAFVYVMNGLMPGPELAASTAPPAEAMATFTKYGALIVCIGGVFACVSTANGLLMTGARIPFSMGRDGRLPKGLCRVSKNGAPYSAILITAIAQLLLALSGSIIFIVQMVVFVTSVSWIISTTCVIFLRRNHPEIRAPFRTPGYPVMLILAYACLVFIFTRLALSAVLVSAAWILSGILCYFLFKNTGLKKLCSGEQ